PGILRSAAVLAITASRRSSRSLERPAAAGSTAGSSRAVARGESDVSKHPAAAEISHLRDVLILVSPSPAPHRGPSLPPADHHPSQLTSVRRGSPWPS